MVATCVAQALPDFTIPESVLLGSEFGSVSWGTAVVYRTDAMDEAVLFTFSGLSGSSTGIKDDYPVDTIYGQNLPSHGNGDFSNFDSYVLRITNIDANSISCSLFINTGFTGPSGNPPNNLNNDTFWQSPWTEILEGQTRVLRLDFDNAIPWNISDNPEPHTQGANGQLTAINVYDRTEVSAIGFQILGEGNPEAALLIAPAQEPICTVEPQGDLNGDCKVDLIDIAIMAKHWLECNLDPNETCWQ
jgi:hypothetical protein